MLPNLTTFPTPPIYIRLWCTFNSSLVAIWRYRESHLERRAQQILAGFPGASLEQYCRRLRETGDPGNRCRERCLEGFPRDPLGPSPVPFLGLSDVKRM
jgi:hypothetical protein